MKPTLMGAPPAAAAGLLAAAAGALAAAAGVLAAAAGVLAAVVGAGELAGAAVFFELEQPAAVSAASTVSATIRFVADIELPSLLATDIR
jgi:hypothetical protein